MYWGLAMPEYYLAVDNFKIIMIMIALITRAKTVI